VPKSTLMLVAAIRKSCREQNTAIRRHFPTVCDKAVVHLQFTPLEVTGGVAQRSTVPGKEQDVAANAETHSGSLDLNECIGTGRYQARSHDSP